MFTAQDVVSVTKMDASNLSMVFAPNFMRCPSKVNPTIFDFCWTRKIIFCGSDCRPLTVYNAQTIAGSIDDNGEHAERDGVCENPDRRSGHSRDGGSSVGSSKEPNF